MKLSKTNLPGVVVMQPTIFGDKRGFFLETFRKDVLLDAGIDADFVQDNHSRSMHGVLRGLHYQMTQPQGKLVRVVTGSVFDVVVDVRLGSPTFGHSFSTQLDEENMKILYVPPGFAHGFIVLSEYTDFIYKCTEYYHPQSEQGIAWDDPDIGINWPRSKMSLSEKDQSNPLLKDQARHLLPAYKDFILDIEDNSK